MNIADIWKYDLRRGATDHPANGACLYDAGMWLVYGRIGDNSPCVCPIIRMYTINLNDNMDNKQRQMLKPFILRVVGNRDTEEIEAKRLHFIVLNTVRRVVPLIFDDIKPDLAGKMRMLTDDASYDRILACIESAADARWRRRRRLRAGASAAVLDAAADAAAYAAVDALTAAQMAAHAAIYANASEAWKEALSILDGALKIGRQSPEFSEAQVRASVITFESAAQCHARELI